MTTASAPERTTLYYRQGASDKVYGCALEPSGAGFVVTFAYGRRGSTLTTGVKTPSPVDYAEARKIYDQLLASKTAKGYTPGQDGTPYQDTPKESRATGLLPQLLNPIDDKDVDGFLRDPAWWAQEKLDGRRVLILKTGDTITGINRKGLVIALSEPIVSAVRNIASDQFLLDGEAIGDVYHAFDLQQLACRDLKQEPYSKRLKALESLLGVDGGSAGASAIQSVPAARTTAAKRTLMDRLRQERREGIVFKRHGAAYVPGRPASGGDQRKLKFTATASCLVAGVNGRKRSVALELLDGRSKVGVGNVTIPPSQPIPCAGAVVEVKYLYAFAGGSLYQPVYLGRRDDLGIDACVVSQLKIKADDSEAEG